MEHFFHGPRGGVFGLFLLVLVQAGVGEAVVAVEALPTEKETPLVADYLEEPVAGWGWAEAYAAGPLFRPLGSQVKSFGASDQAVWFRAKLLGSDRQKPISLVAWGTLLNHLDVWFVDGDGRLLNQYRSGDSVEPDPRQPPSMAFQFPVPPAPEVTALIRIQTEGALVYQIYLWDRESLNRNLELQNLLMGFLIGFLLLMVLINILFHFSLHDSRYLWYAAYVSAMLFFLLVYTGCLRSLLLPSRFPQDVWDVGSFGILLVVTLWFCRQANRLSQVKGNRLFTWTGTAVSVAGSLVALTLDKTLGLVMLNAAMLVISLGCWGFIAVKAWKGDRFSQFFLVAWSLPLVSGLLLSLQAVFASDWDGLNPYYLLAAGVVLETLILSFSFSDEVNRWHRKAQSRLGEAYHEDRLVALGLLAARVGHEVNTPNHVIGLTLASLDSQLRSLGSDETLTAEEMIEKGAQLWSEHSVTLRTASRQISTVIEQLHSGRHPTASPLVGFELGPLLEETYALHRVRWEDKTKRLSWSVPPPGVKVHGYPQRLQQLIVNLVDNATAALETPEGTVKIRVERRLDKALLVVSDDGRGMSEKQVAQLGRPFFSTKPDGTNHGLGWGICQEIAREHRGSLQVQSREGEGTTVTFSMPLG